MHSVVELASGRGNGTAEPENVATRPSENKGVQHLLNFIEGLEALHNKYGPFSLRIQDSQEQETGAIVFIAPGITFQDRRAVATFVVIDPYTGIWGINFNRESEEKADNLGEIYLQQVLDSSLRRGLPVEGSITVTGNNGVVIQLAGERFEQKPNSGIGTVKKLTEEQGFEVVEPSVKAAQAFRSGSVFSDEHETTNAIKEAFDYLTPQT